MKHPFYHTISSICPIIVLCFELSAVINPAGLLSQITYCNSLGFCLQTKVCAPDMIPINLFVHVQTIFLWESPLGSQQSSPTHISASLYPRRRARFGRCRVESMCYLLEPMLRLMHNFRRKFLFTPICVMADDVCINIRTLIYCSGWSADLRCGGLLKGERLHFHVGLFQTANIQDHHVFLFAGRFADNHKVIDPCLPSYARAFDADDPSRAQNVKAIPLVLDLRSLLAPFLSPAFCSLESFLGLWRTLPFFKRK